MPENKNKNETPPEGGTGGEGTGGGGGGEETGGGEGTEHIEDPQALLEDNRRKNKENQSLRERLRAAEEENASLKEAQMSEQEKAINDAKKAAREEADSYYKPLLAQEKVKALAAGAFNDPADALAYLDLSELDLEDEDAIVDALNELLEAKPYLAADGTNRNGRREGGSIDQGFRGDPGRKAAGGSDWLRGVAGRG